MYEIIEKNKYGVLVDQLSNPSVLACTPCKYSKTKSLNEEPCLSCNCDGYYLSDSEAEKLESEQIIVQDFFKVKSKNDNELLKEMQEMVNNPDNSLADAYTKKVESEMQVFYDSQKELIDLRVELRVEKEKSKALEEYSRGLELKVKELAAKCKSEYQRGIEDGKIIAEHGTTMYQE